MRWREYLDAILYVLRTGSRGALAQNLKCVYNVLQGAYMRRIGVRELRQNAGTYLHDVAEGETIEITHHGPRSPNSFRPPTTPGPP